MIGVFPRQTRCQTQPPTSTKTKIKFFVDPEEEDRDSDRTPDCLGSKQSDLEDEVSYKCSCCEAGGTEWERTRNLLTKKPSVRFSSLTDADVNFCEKGNTDLCELHKKRLGAVAKASGWSIQEREKPSCP